MGEQLASTSNSKKVLPDNPYKGLVPYSEEDAAFFFGREAEQEIIITNLRAWRLTLLYGPSGVGKSSILGAGVTYQLRQLAHLNLLEQGSPEFAVVTYNAWRNEQPLVGLLRQVQEAVSQAWQLDITKVKKVDPSSGSLVEALQFWSNRLEGKLLIILDQFEEYFLYHEHDDVEKNDGNFAYEFARAVNHSGLAANFLISIREDTLAKLDRFKTSLPGLFDNYLRLEHLSLHAARDAIEQPIKEYNRRLPSATAGVEIEPELVTAVLEQTKTGQVVFGNTGRGVIDQEKKINLETPTESRETRVETPFLQLVMTRLWNTEKEKLAAQPGRALRKLTLETLNELGGAERIVRTHLDKVMSSLSQREQETAVRVFNQLVTPSGTKIAHTVPDLSRYIAIPETRLNPLLERLAGSDIRILRPVDPPLNQPEAKRYEIFHDVLAAAILDWRQRYLNEQERQAQSKVLRKRAIQLRVGFAIVGVLLLGAIAIAVGAILYTLQPQRTPVCGPVSTRTVRVKSNNVTTDIYVSGRGGQEPLTRVVSENAEVLPGLFHTLVSVSADGRRLAYVTARDEALDDATIWMVDLQTKERTRIANVPTGLWPIAPYWSADGQSLAYVAQSFNSSSFSNSTSTGPKSPTSNSIVANNPDHLSLWLVNLSSGDPLLPKLLSSDSNLLPSLFYGDSNSAICWSFDNRSLLVGTKSDTGTITGRVEISSFDGITRLLPHSSVLNALGVQPVSKNCATQKPFSQNDPRWKDSLLKSGGSSARIGNSGCALVAASMLLNYYSIALQPNDLTACLGELPSPFLEEGWQLIAQRCSQSILKGGVRGDFSWQGLDAALKKGPAIVGLLGGQTGQHFLVVTSGANGIADNYRVTDPWDGTTYKTIGEFLDTGYRLRWLISYEGNGPDCSITSSTISDQSNNLSIMSSGPEDGALYHQPTTFEYQIIGNPTEINATATRDTPVDAFDNTNQMSLNPNQSYNFTEEGVYNIRFMAQGTDKATPMVIRSIRFVIDRTPPTIILNILTLPETSGKYSSPVTFELKARDQLSGVASIEYQLDGGTWQHYNSDTATNPIIIAAPGQHIISYRATDGSGNLTPTGQITFEIVSKSP